jgi:uncharacterized protein DUF4087
MRNPLLILGAVICLAVVFVSGRAKPAPAISSTDFETRCGWFVNPTPANVWLDDREAEWIIGVQGGYQVPGDWPWPNFKRGQWVVKNAGDYGYGCACLELRVNKKTQEVLEIKTSTARPLAKCRQDASLKRWKME